MPRPKTFWNVKMLAEKFGVETSQVRKALMALKGLEKGFDFKEATFTTDDKNVLRRHFEKLARRAG
jgi:hypothetical protein